LGALTIKREVVNPGMVSGEILQDGTVAKLDKEALPLSGILSKSRTRGRPPRTNDYMHVSDLIGRCVRKVALIEQLGMSTKPQGVSFFDELTFAQGDVVHDVVKRRASSAHPERVWGLWQCQCKTQKTSVPTLLSQVDQAKLCSNCHTPKCFYREFSVRDDVHKVVGNPDLITYEIDLQALHVNELKSISHDAWKELVRPKPEHVIQTLFYWDLLHRQGYRLTDRISILYITRGWLYSGSPVKEFTLNAPEEVARLAPLYADALAIKQAREGGNLPPRICASAQVTQAKNCEVCATCFGTNNEAPKKISISSALRRAP